MKSWIPTGNIALLIDADNVSHTALEVVLSQLAELGTVNIRRAYGNWRKDALKEWAAMAILNGIQPQQQFDVTKGKNATDMMMTIDAMDLLYTRQVDGFGIMSSDSDFMPLVTRIRQNGIPVYGFGETKTPVAFKAACTLFTYINAAEPSEQLQSAGTTEDRPAPEAPEASTPCQRPISAKVTKHLAKAYSACKSDARGYVSLSPLGQQANWKTLQSGYARLSDLVAGASIFDIERRDGQVFVKLIPDRITAP